jgi:polysaccharide export outer membrane protein
MYRLASATIFLILSCACVAAGPASTALSKEAIEYVRDARKAGLTDKQIQQNLLKAGWNTAEVDAAIHSGRDDSTQPANANQQAKGDTAEVTPQAKQLDSPMPKPLAAGPTEPPSNPVPPRTPSVSLPTTEAPAETTAAPDRKMADEYVIGEGDVLQIHVWNEPKVSVPNVVVRPDGMITVPLVHQVKVASLTPSQVEKLLAERLAEFDTAITAASVTVVVSEINSKKVYMTGALKKEGAIPYTYQMTVMQAISEAGGLTEFAKTRDIYVLRNENGKQHQFKFDYRGVLKGRHAEGNIELKPGDTVVVPH